MEFEETYLALEPKLRSFALVGTYMGYYAAMEFEINNAIEKCLAVSASEALIIYSNLNFSGKIKILKTLNDAYTDSQLVKSNESNLNKVSKLSVERNFIAHAVFTPSLKKNGGVIFHRSKATKKLLLLDTEWSISDFKDRCSKLSQAKKFISEMSNKLMTSADEVRKEVRSILTDAPNQK